MSAGKTKDARSPQTILPGMLAGMVLMAIVAGAI
jgi:hypothetical protein